MSAAKGGKAVRGGAAKGVISVNVNQEHHERLTAILRLHEEFQKGESLSFSEFLRYFESAVARVIEVAADYHEYCQLQSEPRRPVDQDPEDDKRKEFLRTVQLIMLRGRQSGFDLGKDPEHESFWGNPVTYAAYTVLSGFARAHPSFSRIHGNNALDYLGFLIKDGERQRKSEQDLEWQLSRQTRQAQDGSIEEARREIVADLVEAALPRLGLHRVADVFEAAGRSRGRMPDPRVHPWAHFLTERPELSSPLDAVDDAEALVTTLVDLVERHAMSPIPAREVTAQREQARDQLKTLDSRRPDKAGSADESRRRELTKRARRRLDALEALAEHRQEFDALVAVMRDLEALGKLPRDEEDLGSAGPEMPDDAYPDEVDLPFGNEDGPEDAFSEEDDRGFGGPDVPDEADLPGGDEDDAAAAVSQTRNTNQAAADKRR